ncbi:MAG TPA: RNA polymerase sigma factor [Actinomycetota bacterium]|nr:RNA polymerase sigma factor [Actinomycetota bacterium]
MSTAESDLRAAIRQLSATASRLARKDGEDLVQEALARALAKGVDPRALPWLRTVTRNLAVDRARRAREVASGGSEEMDRMVTDLTVGPEDQVMTAEDRRAVRVALATLPPRYRDALVVYANTGDAREVARTFDLTQGATHTLLCRARERLRAALERSGFVPGTFLARLQRWQEALTAGCLAAGLAAGGLLGAGAPGPAPVRAPEAARSAAVAPIVTEASSGSVVRAVQPRSAAAGQTVAAPVGGTPAREVVADVGLGCSEEGPDGGSGPVVGVRIENGTEDTPVDVLADALRGRPDGTPGGCV